MTIKEVDTKEELYKATKECSTPAIYLLKCGIYYKIGRSDAILNRIKTLQIGNPYEIELVFFARTEKDVEVERNLHKMFIHRNKRGEWFELTNSDLIALEEFIRNTWTTNVNPETEKSS